MLILSRKKQETIMIGDDIQITVLGYDGVNVKLGISAPRNIPVHRTEIYMRIKLKKIKNRNDKTCPRM